MRLWCCLLFVSCLILCDLPCHANYEGGDDDNQYDWPYDWNITESMYQSYMGTNLTSSYGEEDDGSILTMAKMGLRRESVKFVFRRDSYPAIKTLDLSNNLLTGFDNESYLETKFPNIEDLNLKRNRLTRLPKLKSCTNLTVLNLSYNSGLVIGRGDVIKYLPATIEVLRLKHTATQIFFNDSLSSLPKLRILILSDGDREGRRNRQFLPGSLDNLEFLEELDISRSHWVSDTTERPELLRHMTSLRIFKAERCYFRSMRVLTNAAMRSQLPFVENLETLWLSGNSRMREASLIFSSPNFSNLTSLHLDSVPLNRMSDSLNAFKNMENLEDLGIRKTRISEHNVENLGSLSKLRTLDLRDNRLTKIPPLPLTLRNLHFTGNRVRHITRSSVPPELQQLDLSNQAIATIEDHSFYTNRSELADYEASANQIAKLNLSGNHLTSLSPHAFHGLVSMTTLDLGSNRLARLDSISEDASRLTTLIVAMNQLTYISRKFFENLHDLEYLDLSRNLLQHLEIKLPSLETLHLSNNSFGTLREITENSLFPNLLYANLSSNHFTALPPNALSRCFPKLETLRIDDNSNLSSIHPLAFQNMTSLLSVSCQNGKLELDSFQAFAEVENLTELKLTGNAITTFVDVPLINLQILELHRNRIANLTGPNISHLLPNIQILNLKDNSIAYVQPQILDGMDNLRFIDFKVNPIGCPCDMDGTVEYEMDDRKRAASFDYLRDWIRSTAQKRYHSQWLTEVESVNEVMNEFADCKFEPQKLNSASASSSAVSCMEAIHSLHYGILELSGWDLGPNDYGSAAPSQPIPIEVDDAQLLFGTEN